jgi:NADH dehydrogenase (ubiquinone) 1 alpha subcomplex subunit 9
MRQSELTFVFLSFFFLSLLDGRNFDFKKVHVDAAELIAKVAADSGVHNLVHVSHLNAAHDSPSAFYRSKAEGEEKVREAFTGATIIRPSTMFGYEDRLLNNMASA